MVALIAVAIGAILALAAGQPKVPDRPTGSPAGRAEQGGLVLELWFDRTQIRLGERSVAHVRVTNHGPASPEREGNVCPDGPAPVRVTGTAGSLGRNWIGAAAQFKELVLTEEELLEHGKFVMGRFMEVGYARRAGPVGCPAASEPRLFKPGEVLEATLVWDAVPVSGRSPRPGPGLIVATFGSSAGDLSTEVEIEIGVGQLPAAMSLVDYVDAAMASDEFRLWLTERPREAWLNTSIVRWPNQQGEYPPLPAYQGVSVPVIEVGLHTETADGFEFGAVIVDERTRTVIGARFEP